MIQMQSNLDVADNSGAKRVQCIKVLGGSKRRTAGVGDVIVVSRQGSAAARPREEGRRPPRRHRAHREGHPPRRRLVIRFDGNAAVLVNKNEEPIGTRIFGPVVRELRAKQLHEDHLARAGGAVMAAAKIKKGDSVVVLSGKDKGRTGDVTQAMPKDGKVVGRRHQRRRAPPQAEPGQPAGRHRRAREAPMHVSKVAHRDPKDGKPTRVRFETQGRQEGPRCRQVRGDHQWLSKYTPRLQAACTTSASSRR